MQVYYGAWRGLEVAIKVMSADITRQVAAGIEVGHPRFSCPSKGAFTGCSLSGQCWYKA